MRRLAALILLVGLVAVVSTVGYVEIMFDRQWKCDLWRVWACESLVEGAYFSLQTVTTVGYGNWEPAKSSTWPPAVRNGKVLRLKRFSLLVMAIGATLFPASIGVAVTILTGLGPLPQREA